MKGLVKVTPESLNKLASRCYVFIVDFSTESYGKKELKWSWSKFKKVEWTSYRGLPFWYQYKDSLIRHIEKLHDIADQADEDGDEIWLSELSYCHLVMLSKGDKHANPIYIMNY